MTSAVSLSVTVGTSTSQSAAAARSASADIGASVGLSCVSNSSLRRVSIACGNFRVTRTEGFSVDIDPFTGPGMHRLYQPGGALSRGGGPCIRYTASRQ